MGSPERCTAVEAAELDALARELVVPVDKLLTAILAEWPDRDMMPSGLAAATHSLIAAFLPLLEHPTFQRLQAAEQS